MTNDKTIIDHLNIYHVVQTYIIIISLRMSYMNSAFCAMKSSIADKLPNDWLVTIKKNTPIL